MNAKKTIKRIMAMVIVMVTVLTAALPCAMAEGIDPSCFNKNTPKSEFAEYVKDAPHVEFSLLNTFFGAGITARKVDQYKIQPNHYYVMMTPGKSKMPHFGFKLIKVIRVYEDPTWYGSERTIDYVNVKTLGFGTKAVNKGLKPVHLYEVSVFQ